MCRKGCVARPSICRVSQRRRSREGDSAVRKGNTPKYQDRSRFPTPPRQLYPSRAEILDKGKVERRNAVYSTVRIIGPLRSTPPCGLRATAVSCPGSRVGEDQREEEKMVSRCGGMAVLYTPFETPWNSLVAVVFQLSLLGIGTDI